MISDKEDHQINGETLKPRASCCTTYNIIYALHCTVCNKYYVGRTVRKLQERIGEHRRSFYKVVENVNIILGNNLYRDEGEFSAGLHLIHEHPYIAYNKTFILDVCSPRVLEVREHKYIHDLKTLKPYGINSASPFGMNILHL